MANLLNENYVSMNGKNGKKNAEFFLGSPLKIGAGFMQKITSPLKVGAEYMQESTEKEEELLSPLKRMIEKMGSSDKKPDSKKKEASIKVIVKSPKKESTHRQRLNSDKKEDLFRIEDVSEMSLPLVKGYPGEKVFEEITLTSPITDMTGKSLNFTSGGLVLPTMKVKDSLKKIASRKESESVKDVMSAQSDKITKKLVLKVDTNIPAQDHQSTMSSCESPARRRLKQLNLGEFNTNLNTRNAAMLKIDCELILAQCDL